jgi:hypothetical protein
VSTPAQTGCSFHAFVTLHMEKGLFTFITLSFWHDLVN